jgi:hypothetical protein
MFVPLKMALCHTMATTTQAIKYAELTERCHDLLHQLLSVILVGQAHMTLADFRHPIASKCDVRPVARSEAILPGSYTFRALLRTDPAWLT